MSRFADYADKYRCARMERREGILLVTLHTEGKELQWGSLPHGELPEAFRDIAGDRENRVVILTGTGKEFSGPKPPPGQRYRRPAVDWDKTFTEARFILTNMLDIDVPMISAVNGPAMRHSELPLLCDIVLASTQASFEDAGHFEGGLVPGDGVNVIYPMLMGMNRGRYFLLTGQRIGAQEAKDLGLVNEVLAPEDLMPRAWELAEKLARYPLLHLKYTRMVLVEEIKQRLRQQLNYSLALEIMANHENPDPPKTA